jgi:short-subunit dehydrogenase
MSKPFAVVTGASSGIGLESAAICAREGLAEPGSTRKGIE